MKKIVCFLLASLLLMSVMGFSAYANMVDGLSSEYIQNTTNAYDLQAYGVHTFTSYKVDVAPAIDGYLSVGEYPGLSDSAKLGDGLWFSNGTSKQDYSSMSTRIDGYENIVVNTYLAYDNTYAYIAEEVVSDKAIITSTESYVRYGLNQSSLIPEAYSRLQNQYKYTVSGDTLTNGTVSGDRYCYELRNGLESKKGTLGGYTDGDGTKWDKNTYKVAENNSASKTENNGIITYVFEYRIPLADIAFSAFGAFDEAKTAELIASGQFFGFYQFCLKVNSKPAYVTTSLPGGANMPAYSGDNSIPAKGLSAALKEFYTNEAGESLEQDYLPSPVYHFPTNDPTSVSIPASSGFRPGISSYGWLDVPSVFRMVNDEGQYKKGDYQKFYEFSVVPTGVDNTNPMTGDARIVPTQYRLRSGYATKKSGTDFIDYSVCRIDVSKLSSGLYTLVVTFSTQKWDGQAWVNTGETRNIATSVTIAGSTRAANPSAGTGDDTILFVACGLLVASAAITAAVLVAKKRRSISI